MEKVERLNMFKEALSMINDSNVRTFCEALLVDADEYFFHEPASSTGKYHPKYALGEGGLARHSIATAKILAEILRTECFVFSDIQKDMLICAAIVHDIKKYGNNKVHTVKEHPELASKYIINEQEEKGIVSEKDAQYMADAVLTHMGQWGNVRPETEAQKLVHMADCLASRKWLNVEFAEEVGDNFMVAEEVKKEVSPGDYVLPFGKYSGKKLSEIDEGYVEFLATKFAGQNHPAAINAKKYLSEKK